MPIKVLIVDDSLLFREQLARLLSNDVAITVVGKAIDAYDAEKKILELKPDVVTLDVEMPKVSGIDFLKQIMQKAPVRVVVVTATPTRAFDALSAGAVDFVNKPLIKSPLDMETFATKLTSMVKIAAVANLNKKPTAQTITTHLLGNRISAVKGRNLVIALGASTGGTDALQAVVQELPENTPGIIIVQHMPAGFTKMYAERLDRVCKMKVKEAENGDRVEQGKIIVGAGGYHLRLCKDSNGYYITSKPGDKVSGHCPSVDVMFNSVAEVAGKNAVGAILTGMGSDGALGLKKLKENGGYTIGQDKATSVVYGMPMVAFNIGAVEKQAPLQQIAKLILEKCE